MGGSCSAIVAGRDGGSRERWIMESLWLSASLLFLALHCLALAWLWQIRRQMNTPADRTERAPASDAEGTHEENESWLVSDAEQAQQEQQLLRQSQRRVTERTWR
ncbi:MAG: hypothetical protein D4R44_06935 [Actinobacteria bacterium]|nr:MAG: hypothetical protein D4R44_06935 [Actinomycetota bacterium]